MSNSDTSPRTAPIRVTTLEEIGREGAPMIERVAEALFHAGIRTSVFPDFDVHQAYYNDWSKVEDELKNGFRANARVVLATMSAPSRAMKVAGLAACGGDGAVFDGWEAMIGAALAEDGK